MNTQILNYNKDPEAISTLVEDLINGNIIIFPTDTVYGIGCDAFNKKALTNLFKIKKRNKNKPINVLVSNMDMVNKLVKKVNSIEEKLIKNFWPGALTIIFDKSDIVSDLLTSGLSTIGIRMPGNKLCLNLINVFGAPIATSSANISDNPPTTCTAELIQFFLGKTNFILDGGTIHNGLPSTIVRVENNEIKILREGSITKNDLIKCFGGNINVR